VSESAPVAASGADEPSRTSASKAVKPEKRRGLFARIALFIRQVIAELKKVVWLTRSDLITYTIVVLVFVAVVMAFVTVVDLGIGQLTRWAFGG
jgi:preprotein translocase subunit SecE